MKSTLWQTKTEETSISLLKVVDIFFLMSIMRPSVAGIPRDTQRREFFNNLDNR
jgi:hypothetical protein